MKGLDRSGALCSTCAKLGFGDYAYRDVLSWVRKQMTKDVSVLLESIDAGVGIEKELHHHSELSSFLHVALGGALEIVRDARERLDVSLGPLADWFEDH